VSFRLLFHAIPLIPHDAEKGREIANNQSGISAI
jgi:hypothetical protein